MICLLVGAAYLFADTYKEVTDFSSLAAEDQVILVGENEDKSYAMSTNQKSSNRGAVEVTVATDGTIDPTTETNETYDVQILILKTGASEGTFAFYTGAKYLYAAFGSSNQLNSGDQLNDNASFAISATGIIATESTNRNVMQFNYNSGSPMFACYSSASQTAVKLYKKVETTVDPDAAALTVSPESVDFGTITTAGTFESKEITVTYANLTNLAVTLAGDNAAAFELEGKDELVAGTSDKLTVKCTATTVGTYTAKVTIASTELTKEVTLSAQILDIDHAGTQEDPLTIADVIKLDNTVAQEFWVEGVILGYVDYNTKEIWDATKAGNSNIVLGAELDGATAIDATKHVAVQLPSGSVRDDLNIKDNANYVGRTVKVKGSLEEYYSIAGVKNTSAYELLSAPCTKIELDKAEATVNQGATITLTATVTPVYTSDNVTWESNDTDVATVANGVVTGVAAGTATITVKAGEQTATCTVEVTTNPVLTVDETPIDFGVVKEGATFVDKTLSVTGVNLTEVPVATITEGATIFAVSGNLTKEDGTLTISCTATTVGEHTGKLTVVADGITKTIVLKAQVKALTGTFTLYTAETLENGDYVLVGLIADDAASANAMSTTNNNGRLANGKATFTDGKIVNPDDAVVWMITKDEDDHYTIYNKEAGAYAVGTGFANKLAIATTPEAEAHHWTVSVANNLWAFVSEKNATANVNKTLQNNGEYGFACYGADYSTYITLYKKTASGTTALENTTTEVKARKVIENGQMIIIKDGVRYNIFGSVIE